MDLALQIRGQKGSDVFLIYLFNYQYFVASYRSAIIPLQDLNVNVPIFRSFGYIIMDFRGQNVKTLTLISRKDKNFEMH